MHRTLWSKAVLSYDYGTSSSSDLVDDGALAGLEREP